MRHTIIILLTLCSTLRAMEINYKQATSEERALAAELIEASRKSDVVTVRALLARGARADIYNQEGITPFYSHSKKIVQLLLHSLLLKEKSSQLLLTLYALKKNSPDVLYKERFTLILPYLIEEIPVESLIKLSSSDNSCAQSLGKQALFKRLHTRAQKLKLVLCRNNKLPYNAYQQVYCDLLKCVTTNPIPEHIRLRDPHAIDTDLKQFIEAAQKKEITSLPENNIFKAAYDISVEEAQPTPSSCFSWLSYIRAYLPW